jgi:hypothetical protein
LPEARPEHIAAIAWLNESTAASFYIIKAEAIRIVAEDGTVSVSAPLMTLLLGPSPESSAIGKTKKELVQRHDERRQFWKSLIERIPAKTKLHSTLSPTSENWIGTSLVKSWLLLSYVIEMNRTRVELYIDRGVSSDDNQAIFDHFFFHREQIESTFGGELSWEVLDGRRACRIAARFESGGYRSPVELWPQIQDDLINAMIRFEQSIRPYAESLP